MSKGIETSIMRDIVPALFVICRRFFAWNGSKRDSTLTEAASSGQTLFCALSKAGQSDAVLYFCITLDNGLVLSL